jgi:hypothetical protein
MAKSYSIYIYIYIYLEYAPQFLDPFTYQWALRLWIMVQSTWSTDTSLRCWFPFLWIYTRSEIAESYGSSRLNFFKVTPYCFNSGCTDVYSQLQCTNAPFSPHPCQQLSLLFNNGHVNKCEVICPCVFPLTHS